MLIEFKNFSLRAIKCFNMAIKSNPIYIRAYMCRARAFKKIHNVCIFMYFFDIIFFNRKYRRRTGFLTFFLSTNLSTCGTLKIQIGAPALNKKYDDNQF